MIRRTIIYTTYWGQTFLITNDYEAYYEPLGIKEIDDYNIENFKLHKLNCGFYILDAKERRAEDNEYTLNELYDYIDKNIKKDD